MDSPVRFIHISDTHFGPTKDFVFQGRVPYQDSERLVADILALPFTPDFVIHTGDVISFQDEAAYGHAAEVLGRLGLPLYFATGNHDDPKLLNRFPLFAERKPLIERDDAVSYSFERSGYLFITLDPKHPDDDDPSGILPADQLAALSRLLASTTQRFVIFTHFPALPLDAPWMDENLRISNGAELHELLARHAKRCAGVFFGHIHQSLLLSKEGIHYTSVPSATFQFGAWPTDREILSYNEKGLPGANLITLLGSQTVVKHLYFSRS